MTAREWRWVDPEALLPGRTLLLAPHVDDCVLGCGGTIALLSRPERVHVAYATDGSRSPEPLLPGWDGRDPHALVRDRMAEGRRAMASLGVPEEQVHFLGFPDGELRKHGSTLEASLSSLVKKIGPDRVLAPFRFDRHPDHLALNRCATRLSASGGSGLIEYFVYHRSRLLRQGDVRRYIRPELLVQVDTATVADRKAEALALFRSQTTLYYDWQTRPVLSPELISRVSMEPEVFLEHDPSIRGGAVFTQGAGWIGVATAVEPVIKRRKDQLVALCRRMVRRG
jgi:LmbE family N-acetylglucosaminyl deacetylase